MNTNSQNSQNIMELVNSVDIADYAFKLIEKHNDADAAIDALLKKAGTELDTDNIAVFELVEHGAAFRCSYEWSKDGKKEMLNLEQRYIDKLRKKMMSRYANIPQGVYLYQQGNGKLEASALNNPESVKTLLQIPIYNGTEFTGYINFINFENDNDWSENSVDVAIKICRIISSYLFGMRKVDESREELRELVKVDQVTKLLYYDEFVSTLKSGFAVGFGHRLSICCADITNFKYINEVYGYEMGDRLLTLFAKTFYDYFSRVLAGCREYSDNFLMAGKIPVGVPEERIRERFIEFGKLFVERAAELVPDGNIAVNIGSSVLDPDDDDIETAIANANVARKVARMRFEESSVKVEVFNHDMIAKRHKEQELISGLKDALDNDEFKVYYQPKISSETMKICGAEALVRWVKPTGSMIYPDEFIPAFEQDGCIAQVDYRVYEKVFKSLRARLDAGLECVRISMNVSRVHMFSRSFISYIDYLLNRYHIPVGLLEFELTESMYVEELPMLKYSVDHLRAKNIKLSIDDFGSGYSSLNMLTEIPIDVIKLDRVFMKEELSDNDKIIIGTIIDMCHHLGIKTLCEGVENEDQVAFLRYSFCDEMQGYYFAKPIEESAFYKLLENQQSL